MIPYRFLAPAEEEMSEAALFYETAANGLGNDFLDDVERAIETLSDYPELGGARRCGVQTNAATPFSRAEGKCLLQQLAELRVAAVVGPARGRAADFCVLDVSVGAVVQEKLNHRPVSV